MNFGAVKRVSLAKIFLFTALFIFNTAAAWHTGKSEFDSHCLHYWKIDNPINKASQDTLRFAQRAPSFSQKRFWGVMGGSLGIYGISLGVLSQYWYKDYPRSSFHFFN